MLKFKYMSLIKELYKNDTLEFQELVFNSNISRCDILVV
jgi:hypothetical protein